MIFHAMRIKSGSYLDLNNHEPSMSCDDRLTVAICAQGSTVSAGAQTLALWSPIRGGIGITAADWSAQLCKGDIYVGDTKTPYDVTVSSRGAALAIAGTSKAWSALDKNKSADISFATALFPAFHRDKKHLCRQFLRFALHCSSDYPLRNTLLAQVLASLVNDLQTEFLDAVFRCPGATLSRKQSVFLRLQRVRHYISACAHQDLDVENLALMANYSLSHFITTFRTVFDETPYSSVCRRRLESASNLLSGSKLGIADIAKTTGFESRSSFSRAIKRHLGLSAREFREINGHAHTR